MKSLLIALVSFPLFASVASADQFIQTRHDGGFGEGEDIVIQTVDYGVNGYNAKTDTFYSAAVGVGASLNGDDALVIRGDLEATRLIDRNWSVNARVEPMLIDNNFRVKTEANVRYTF